MLFHVKYAQLCWTMQMNNTRTYTHTHTVFWGFHEQDLSQAETTQHYKVSTPSLLQPSVQAPSANIQM